MAERLRRYGTDGKLIKAQKGPSNIQMLKNLGAAAGRALGTEGHILAPKAVVDQRAAICRRCDKWDDSARAGLGKCQLCGCTRAKWRLATERCPIGKWERVDIKE